MAPPAAEIPFALGNRDGIPLAQMLKALGVAGSGGEAKVLVQGGLVKVNGEVETRRGHKVVPGDLVEAAGKAIRVTAGGATPQP